MIFWSVDSSDFMMSIFCVENFYTYNIFVANFFVLNNCTKPSTCIRHSWIPNVLLSLFISLRMMLFYLIDYYYSLEPVRSVLDIRRNSADGSSLRRSLLQLQPVSFAGLLDCQHVLGNLTARVLHHNGNTTTDNIFNLFCFRSTTDESRTLYNLDEQHETLT